jgi:hypothetical protein
MARSESGGAPRRGNRDMRVIVGDREASRIDAEAERSAGVQRERLLSE